MLLITEPSLQPPCMGSLKLKVTIEIPLQFAQNPCPLVALVVSLNATTPWHPQWEIRLHRIQDCFSFQPKPLLEQDGRLWFLVWERRQLD